MRILLVGATGTIGRAIAEALDSPHEVIRVGCNTGDLRVNLTSKNSIKKLFQSVGPCDAVICAASAGKIGRSTGGMEATLKPGLDTKLLGQVNLVRIAQAYLTDNGCVTLTSGSVANLPIPGAATMAAVNWAVESFVRSAASELPRGIRINAVSPVPVTETVQAMGIKFDDSIPAAQTALAYKESLEGQQTGEILDARAYASTSAPPARRATA